MKTILAICATMVVVGLAICAGWAFLGWSDWVLVAGMPLWTIGLWHGIAEAREFYNNQEKRITAR